MWRSDTIPPSTTQTTSSRRLPDRCETSRVSAWCVDGHHSAFLSAVVGAQIVSSALVKNLRDAAPSCAPCTVFFAKLNQQYCRLFPNGKLCLYTLTAARCVQCNHPECPIKVDENNPIYSTLSRTCLRISNTDPQKRNAVPVVKGSTHMNHRGVIPTLSSRSTLRYTDSISSSKPGSYLCHHHNCRLGEEAPHASETFTKKCLDT